MSVTPHCKVTKRRATPVMRLAHDKACPEHVHEPSLATIPLSARRPFVGCFAIFKNLKKSFEYFLDQ